jgi:hypothetical protein
LIEIKGSPLAGQYFLRRLYQLSGLAKQYFRSFYTFKWEFGILPLHTTNQGSLAVQ